MQSCHHSPWRKHTCCSNGSTLSSAADKGVSAQGRVSVIFTGSVSILPKVTGPSLPIIISVTCLGSVIISKILALVLGTMWISGSMKAIVVSYWTLEDLQIFTFHAGCQPNKPHSHLAARCDNCTSRILHALCVDNVWYSLRCEVHQDLWELHSKYDFFPSQWHHSQWPVPQPGCSFVFC